LDENKEDKAFVVTLAT